MNKVPQIDDLAKELMEILEHDHPATSCESNTCEVCIARRYNKPFAAISTFHSSFDASAKFDSLIRKNNEQIESRAAKEFSELLNTVEVAKCAKCKKFVYEPSLSDFECSGCGSNLLCESIVVAFLKPLKDRRDTIKLLTELQESGILNAVSRSIVQIVEKKTSEFTTEGFLRLEGSVIHHKSEPLKEFSIGVKDSSAFKVAKIQVTPVKRAA